MNIKFEKGEITFRFFDLVEQMTEDQKKELIEFLSCDEQIIEHVVSQITTGYTQNCSSGSRGCGFDVEPHTALDKARRRIAESAGQVAADELKSAMNSLRNQQAWHDHYRDWAFAMYHAWGNQQQCPQKESPKTGSWDEYEVIKKQKGAQ